MYFRNLPGKKNKLHISRVQWHFIKEGLGGKGSPGKVGCQEVSGEGRRENVARSRTNQGVSR